jgi:hypothetical protein
MFSGWARAIVLASGALAGLAAPGLGQAQAAPAARAGAPVAAAPAVATPDGVAPALPAGETGREPRAAWHVAEDAHVRVEELRVRGESRHITVQPKLPGVQAYEITPSSGGLDPSQRGRRAPGTSQWRVLSF